MVKNILLLLEAQVLKWRQSKATASICNSQKKKHHSRNILMNQLCKALTGTSYAR
jgi:hypothetical protein